MAEDATQTTETTTNGDTSGESSGQAGGQETGQENNQPGSYRTQEDFDKAFARKLEKERKRIADELKAESEEAAKKARMDEAERAKAEKEEAEKNASAKVAAADQRIIRSEAKITALAEGAKPERADAVLRLADLSDVEMDAKTGDPDAEALKAAVSKVLSDYPEFKAGETTVGGGTNPAGGGSAPDKNPFDKEHRNLTEQARLMRENPALAKKLQEEAKK